MQEVSDKISRNQATIYARRFIKTGQKLHKTQPENKKDSKQEKQEITRKKFATEVA